MSGKRQQTLETLARLEKAHGDAAIALHYGNDLELLIATILSAQCTDVRVNLVTESLFRRYHTAVDYAGADLPELESLIRSTGFFRNKAKNIIACGSMLVESHGGKVPESMAELTALPGVGRKTANVVLGNAFGTPGMVVDTHVKRVSFRLGWTRQTDPEKVEQELCRLLPPEVWTSTSHVLIFHGRRFCKAPTPLCSTCPVADLCPKKGVIRSK